MLRKREDYPEEGELVFCKVTSVQHHSVFVQIDEFNRSGMIHISEVSPGRIRNIRDYVKEGKHIVTKVLRVNKERGHIDLSLRRVTENQRRNVVQKIKQEQKAEKIIEYLSTQLKKPAQEVYDQIAPHVLDKYDGIFDSFMDVVNEENTFADMGVNKTIATKLEAIVKERIKPEEVHIKGTLQLLTYAPDGLTIIKKALKSAEQQDSEITYLGGGRYQVKVRAPEYKSAEKRLAKASEAAIQVVQKNNGEGTFEREQ